MKLQNLTTPILSICVPTYNRPKELSECLQAILEAVQGYENEVEIIVSNDAGPDTNEEVVRRFQKDNLSLIYHRNINNMRDGNFFVLAKLARGKYLWIFGDDDRIESTTIGKVLKLLESCSNLIICNHSVFSNDFSTLIRKGFLPFNRDTIFNDHNELLTHFGPKLGFISCIIIKKELFLAVPADEWEPLLPYGFAFLYSIYLAMLNRCKAYVIAEPLVRNRGSDLCANKEWWYKCFVMGTSMVFEELRKKGYSKPAIHRAKRLLLREYVMHDLSLRRSKGEDVSGLFRLMLPYYKDQWFFWMVCGPLLFLPLFFIKIANRMCSSLE